MQMMTVQNTSISRDIHKSTLEQYVKAAFRAYACNEKKCVPTVEQIFLILIELLLTSILRSVIHAPFLFYIKK